MDFPSLALDLAFLRDLSAAQSKGGPRAAQRKVDELPLARQRQLVERATRHTVGLALFGLRRSGHSIGRPFAESAENATFTAVTCNDTPCPQGREVGDQLAARLGPHYPLLGCGMNGNPCFYWDRPQLEMPVPTGKGLPTTLMVQSVHDPATNVSLARSAHSRYAGSRLLTITGEGDHGIYGGVNKWRRQDRQHLPHHREGAGQGHHLRGRRHSGPDRSIFRRLCRRRATEPGGRIHQSGLGLSALIYGSRREITPNTP